MAVVKSLRVQMYEAIRGGITAVLAAPAWGFDDRSVVSEPSESPQTEQFLSVRLLVLNAKVDIVPGVTAGQDGDPEDPDDQPKVYTYHTVVSTVRVQCLGAQAWSWLEMFIDGLEDDGLIAFFRSKGFAVESDDAGISDISQLVGAREQTRGTATIRVSCRVIRERVTAYAEHLNVGVSLASLDPDEPVMVLPPIVIDLLE